MFVPSSDADLVEWVVTDMSAAPPEIAIGSMVHSLSNDGPILARLGELTAPVVAINPDHPATDVESLGRHGVKTVIMPGVGHFLMMEDPDIFNRLLAEIIDGFIA
jgi:pimeloyl-ACP methyl ester carboxylesterase